MATVNDENQIRCSFCGKYENEVLRIFEGPNVCICNECIALCNHYMGENYDYKEDEIRVMCPVDAVFKQQEVGENGNANMYYMAMTTQAPEGAVAFREGDRGVLLPDVMQLEGKKSKTIWLALASLSGSTWTYFGKNSTSAKPIGWDYIIEWLDENGMYRDNLKHEAHQPIVYDIVPRYLFTLLLHFGYRGPRYEQIDSVLKRTALITLKMQSITGEIAFGGRSNQFIHNEGMLAIIFEFEANRYAQLGDFETAGRFKAAIARALEVTEHWLDREPIRHIKNRFPTETRYGCEKYAYFDKYMITTASHLFSAFMICDDSISTSDFDDSDSCFMTSEHFHKLFMRSGGYFLEFDTNADPHYDSSGLGRIHRYGAPSPICMNLPCPSKPNYSICTDERIRAALCPGKEIDGVPVFTCDFDEKIKIVDYSCNSATLDYPLGLHADYSIDKDGVKVTVTGDGKVLHLLPAFAFDGEKETEITLANNILLIKYDGWICQYSSNGEIKELGKTARNRNGFYKLFYAECNDTLIVNIKIIK